MGTASDHAAAACAPDDPYGGGCRVLGWGGGREIASTKCATLTLVKCPLPSRVAPEPGGVERDQRPPRGRTYGVGDNCSWPPMRTHRSGHGPRGNQGRDGCSGGLFSTASTVPGRRVGWRVQPAFRGKLLGIDDAGHDDTPWPCRLRGQAHHWGGGYIPVPAIVRRCHQSAVFLQMRPSALEL